MIGRLAIVALAVGLASCAGLEPAGRNARSSGPAPTVTAPPARQTAPTLPPPSRTTPAPAPVTTQTPPPQPLVVPPAPQQQAAPAPQRTTPAPQRTQAPPAAAPQVTAPPSTGPAPTAPRAQSDDDVVVQGQVQTQVPPPAGDPRTNEERRADVRSWDQCVSQVQSAFDSDPMRPQLTTPEEYCSQSLGMADRGSVPVSRRQRR